MTAINIPKEQSTFLMRLSDIASKHMKFVKEKRQTLMMVSTVMLGLTLAVLANLPGGYWTEGQQCPSWVDKCNPGTSIIAIYQNGTYESLTFAGETSAQISLGSILLLAVGPLVDDALFTFVYSVATTANLYLISVVILNVVRATAISGSKTSSKTQQVNATIWVILLAGLLFLKFVKYLIKITIAYFAETA